MSDPSGNLDAEQTASAPSRMRSLGHVVLIVLLVAVVVGICAHSPSQTYAYSQVRWIGIWIGAFSSGNWLMPRNHMGEVLHKPQLHIWVAGGILKATGIYNDFVFRLPSIFAALITALLVYVLGRRWYGRRVGLLAACLWVTIIHMGKMMYLVTTDMLLTLWITASIVCADRLLFHPAPRGKRLRWVLGLWVTMILGALTKGWGLVNPVLVGGMLALAVAFRPGFKALRGARGPVRKLALFVRLILRRWRRACRAVRLPWGLLAMIAVLVPVWIGMFTQGGQQFRNVVYREFWQRITGRGADAPHASSVPAVVHLLYYALPVSVFALGGLLLERPRRWLSGRGPLCLPFCWIATVVIVFSIPHGFRPDYLLPCYAAVALMGAWAIETVHRAGPGGGRAVRMLRHVFAAVAIAIAVGLIVVPAVYLLSTYLPASARKSLRVPPWMAPETWMVLGMLPAAGLAAVAMAVRFSLRWQIRRVAAVAVLAAIGALFLRTHVISRHAYTRDGEKMIDFARKAGGIIKDDAFVVHRAERLATELYLGRFGRRIVEEIAVPLGQKTIPDELSAPRRQALMKVLADVSEPWLITCDVGLKELGATRRIKGAPQGGKAGKSETVVFVPGDLGAVHYMSEPIVERRWGRIYLIRLRLAPASRPASRPASMPASGPATMPATGPPGG